VTGAIDAPMVGSILSILCVGNGYILPPTAKLRGFLGVRESWEGISSREWRLEARAFYPGLLWAKYLQVDCNK
jgi:hypothetical protein